MKNVTLLVWVTQLGLSVALPAGGFVLLAVWLMNRFGWGRWVLWVGIALGVYCAVTGFVSSVRALSGMSEDKKKEEPPIAFNNHD